MATLTRGSPRTLRNAVLRELEQIVENADDAKLAKIAPTIQHISAHNAYHIGEIARSKAPGTPAKA